MKKTTLLTSVLTGVLAIWSLGSSAQFCFHPASNFQTDVNAIAIANADFNGDGKKDLAVANFGVNNVSILLGDGTGNFGVANNVAVGTGPTGVNSADFNGDGKADLAISNSGTNNVSILLGNGTGGFGGATNFAVGTSPIGVTSADFNGDGKRDLAVSNNGSNNISVLLGNGNGTFQTAVNYTSGTGPINIAWADFNGDTKADLVCTNYNSNNVSVFLGDGTGSFAAGVTYSTATNPRAVACADVNSDAKVDLVVANYTSNSVSVLFGNGNGTFQSAVNYGVSNGPRSVIIADINGNGDLDIATANFNSNNVSLLSGNGNGGFGSVTNFAVGSGSRALVAEDFNADGMIDLATANYNDNNVSVLLGNTVPNVVANASATTVCPGTSVVLNGSGAGLGYYKVYYIRYSDLFSAGYNQCGDAQMLYSTNVGFQWASTEPAGAKVKNVTIQSNMPLDWNGGNHDGYLNNNYLGTQNHGSNTSGWCNSGPVSNLFTYSSSNAANYYNAAGLNQVVITHTGSWFGFYPINGLGNSHDVFATVTVAFDGTYSWSGGVTNGVAFVPGSTNTYTVTGTTEEGCTNMASITINVRPGTNHNFNTTDASCICNGAVDVTASGGTAPFSYLWSNGNTTTAISGACAGQYTLTTTDSQGCTEVSTVNVNSNPATTLSTNSTDATCLCNGTADVTVTSGGTPPFTYAWSNGATTTAITGLCPGNYTITATDSYSVACANAVVVTIADNPTMNFSAIKTNATCTASCNGGVDVTVTGGSSPYTYAWAPAGGTDAIATGLCAGTTYTLTATDNNGCTNVGGTWAIGVTPMTLSFVNTNANCSTSCNGTSSASVSGGTGPYTYAWSNGQTNAMATGLCGGTTYTLTVTSTGGCTQTSMVTVASNPIASINSFSNTVASCESVCNGTSMVSATGGTGAYTYLWAPAGGTNQTATGLCYGTTYTATVKDANGCATVATTTVGLSNNPLDIDWIDTWNASCNGVCNGMAQVNAFGGGGSYSYSWMPGGATTMTASGLCGSYTGTSYTVVVTDATGCKDTSWEYVYIDNPMNINFSLTNVSCASACNGEAAVSSISGGEAPYSYMWSNGATTTSITGLCMGTYSAAVTVTDSLGCKSTEDVSIGNDNDGVHTDGFDYWNTFCNATPCSGAAIGYIDPYSSTGPYTFMWSNGATTTSISGLCAGNYTFMVTDEDGCSDWDDVTIYTNSNVSFSINDIEPSCDNVCNGTATVTNIGGGAGPYTYMWSNGQTNATATGLCGDYNNGITYTVTVKDVNGCTSTDDFTLYSDYYVWTNWWDWNASCNAVCDGKDSVMAYGGTAPYSYLWSNGVTSNVATGLCGSSSGITYTVTVTDSVGCKAIEEMDIYSNTPPTASITKTDVFCSNTCTGSAYAMVNYGTAPYTYTWSNGATTTAISNLCAGPYTLTVKDSKGCMSTTSFNINTLGSSMSLSASVTDATCKTVCNGMATANVSGGTAPYMYAWGPSGGSAATAASLCAGTYSVVVTDANGCTKVLNNIMVDEPAALVVSVTGTNPTSCIEGDGTATANVAGGTAPYTFVWTPGGQITQTAVSLANGTYSVSVVDANGCSAAGSVSVTCTSGVNELAAENIFSVSPNPTHGNLVVTAATGITMDQITVDNVLGQTIFTTANSKHQSAVRVDITAQPAGIYFMSVKADGTIYTQKIIKE